MALPHSAEDPGLKGLALVEIEARTGPGLSRLQMLGLPDTALSEARDRVRAAVLDPEDWPSPVR